MERTKYMSKIMTDTYGQVAIEAIKGGFDGSWERVIARQLRKDCSAGHSEAETIVQSVDGDFTKAAYLITSSKIPEYETK